MRRTPTILWIPFVFSIGTISWAILIVGLLMLAAAIITPSLAELKEAQATRNDYQATLDLLDQQIALQDRFVREATRDPVLRERLASRQLNLNRPDQELLILDPAQKNRDRSIQTLLAQSLTPVTPKPVTPIHPVLALATSPAMRSLLITVACLAIALSFSLGVRFERTPLPS